MAIGVMRCVVFDVQDVERAQAFWSAVTGIPPIGSPVPGRRAYLGHEDERDWVPSLCFRRVRTAKAPDETNRCHVDISPDDYDLTIARIEAIGGRVKRAPNVYPRPGSTFGGGPRIEWAVMQDPDGNEFCLVRALEPAERSALELAARAGDGDDAHWRAVAIGARVTSAAPSRPVPHDRIAPLRCFVVDVEDLERGLAFWSEVTGIPPISTQWPGRYAYLGYEDEQTWDHDLILHRVRGAKAVEVNRAHMDIWVAGDLDDAVGRVLAIGGTLRRQPTIDPQPAVDGEAAPRDEWAVMRDPFGNEFCLRRTLSAPERRAVADASRAAVADVDPRAVARQARLDHERQLRLDPPGSL